MVPNFPIKEELDDVEVRLEYVESVNGVLQDQLAETTPIINPKSGDMCVQRVYRLTCILMFLCHASGARRVCTS